MRSPTFMKPSMKPSSNPSSFSVRSSVAVSSHSATVELKQRILTSLSRLGDRDTYQIAVDDLEKTVLSVSDSPDILLPVLLHCLFDSFSDPKAPVKRESIRLLSFLCLTYSDLSSSQLAKIISHIVKRLKDADNGVRDACRDAIGSLSAQFLKEKDDGIGSSSSLVGLFAKPLFEAMAEQNKSLQSGAAICMGKMVDSVTDQPPVAAFQKLCPRISKLLNSPNYITKASLLPVVGSLSQVGAIAPQSVASLLHSIHECLGCTNWVTRKAAADVLISLAVHSSSLVADKTDSTLTVLEACRFDKIKPVRESLSEALNVWKNIAGKGEARTSDEQKDVSSEQCILERNGETDSLASDGAGMVIRGSSDGLSSNSDSISKAVLILRKKAPRLTGKDLNPEFFQKLEKRGSDDMPVEVILPCRQMNSSNSNTEDESDANTSVSRSRSKGLCRTAGVHPKQRHFGDFAREKWVDERMNGGESRLRACDGDQTEVIQAEASENRENWPPLQRQLLHLERQQTHIMNMLQDFMGGSHDGMISLENRVRGLERIVEEMSREISIQSGARGKTAASWRSDANGWDSSKNGASSRNTQSSTRRTHGTGPSDSEHSGNSRRAWDKSSVPIRLGEGPSARSVWQASKDEATLEAIRVAGEDCGTSRNRRVSIPQAEAIMDEDDDERGGQKGDLFWTCWSNAMHALRVGDTDSAFAEVLSTGDDHLLVKLMDKTGPVLDQLSSDIGNEAIHSITQFLMDHTLFDICLSWIQQLLEVSVENGADFIEIPLELKKELLSNLHEASSTTDPPEEWEGLAPDHLLVQLASNWTIELQHF
ncbi:PREDICTED: microtubule-associated protein SPIRAL2-like [Camelina sativa]|uniref:Microtubule-associated protein SPIRAL2-like n=1 Tax=Camelina sativa TaxID=90675 RepID=A0ABM0YGT7_CAMSA|nr:PREDICTED: microtubule-associated protein SPIRAL2-like [Camelina sativa]